jgi:hypothetical protein
VYLLRSTDIYPYFSIASYVLPGLLLAGVVSGFVLCKLYNMYEHQNRMCMHRVNVLNRVHMLHGCGNSTALTRTMRTCTQFVVRYNRSRSGTPPQALHIQHTQVVTSVLHKRMHAHGCICMDTQTSTRVGICMHIHVSTFDVNMIV